jgi:hypothetical protein
MCTHTYLFLPILFACSKALQFAFHDKHQTKLVLLMGVTTITFPHLQAMPWNLRSEPLTMELAALANANHIYATPSNLKVLWFYISILIEIFSLTSIFAGCIL